MSGQSGRTRRSGGRRGRRGGAWLGEVRRVVRDTVVLHPLAALHSLTLGCQRRFQPSPPSPRRPRHLPAVSSISPQLIHHAQVDPPPTRSSPARLVSLGAQLCLSRSRVRSSANPLPPHLSSTNPLCVAMTALLTPLPRSAQPSLPTATSPGQSPKHPGPPLSPSPCSPPSC